MSWSSDLIWTTAIRKDPEADFVVLPGSGPCPLWGKAAPDSSAAPDDSGAVRRDAGNLRGLFEPHRARQECAFL